MRSRMLISGASLLLVLVLGSVAAQGDAEDIYDERLGDLETRVALLETQVASPIEEAQSGQQSSNTSSTSSQTSISSSNQGGSNVYTASFSSNGDRSIPFTIKNGGVYHLTAHTTSAFSARVVTADGEPLPDFVVESSEAETLTVSGELEVEEYVLEVTTTSQWNVTITSIG